MINYSDLHIVVFTGIHPVLSFFVRQMVAYLEEKSIDYYLADADNPDTYTCSEFDHYIKQPGVVCFMFNNIGSTLQTNDGSNIWKMLGIPVFNFLVDHPRNYGATLRNPACDIYAFALDMDHVVFMKEHYPELKGIFFSPNGGTSLGNNIPYDQRSIDVLYMGNCHEPIDSYPAVNYLPDRGQEYYQYTISTLMQNPSLSTDEVIASYIRERDLSLSEEQIYNLHTNTAIYIETTVRRHTKLSGMKALDDSGIRVEVYGGFWDCEDCPFSENINIHERIDIAELLVKACDAKITLCFMPWFKKGASEKNFDAMLNGSLCVTDSSEYLKQNYVDGKNIVYFDLNNPAQMAADIKWLLTNPEAASVIAQRGYETASKYDTWNNRFDFILEKMTEVL